jgi:ribosomal protein S18 acetylase RimI-like enzyme
MYFSAPNNIVLKPLSSSDAEIVYKEHQSKNTNLHIKRLIDWNPNIGAYDLNGELLGWCLRHQNGALGDLQVRDRYKRRGIGSLIIIAMCKILVSMGMDSFALVKSDNLVLQMLFSKYGFRKTEDVYWMKTSAILSNGVNGVKK